MTHLCYSRTSNLFPIVNRSFKVLSSPSIFWLLSTSQQESDELSRVHYELAFHKPAAIDPGASSHTQDANERPLCPLSVQQSPIFMTRAGLSQLANHNVPSTMSPQTDLLQRSSINKANMQMGELITFKITSLHYAAKYCIMRAFWCACFSRRTAYTLKNTYVD